MVLSARDRHEAETLRPPHQTHRFAGSPESGLDFRTDRHPFDMASKNVGEKGIPLVPAVEPDRFSEKTTADAQPKQGGRHGATGCFPNAK